MGIESPHIGLILRATPSQTGSHRGKSSSPSALVSTLVPALLFSIALLSGFLALRAKQQRVYAPRTYLPTLRKDERTPPSPDKGLFGWVGEFWSLPDEYVLNHQSLDQYLFLRFLKMITIMCFTGCCITWPFLFPVNATGGGGQSGLDVLSFSNVQNPTRYYAHAFAACIFLGFVMFMITRETVYFVNLRQAYLLAPRNASLVSSRTVLFTDVPEASIPHLKRIFQGVERFWIATECDDLQDLIDDRDDAIGKLEKAEIDFLQTARKKKSKNKHISPVSLEERTAGYQNYRQIRPTHRLKPMIGKKVDTIEWSSGELQRLTEKIKNEQYKLRDPTAAKFIGAVFVGFRTQRAARTAFQLTAHENPLKILPRCIGVPPNQIIWKNLGMGSKTRLIRGLIATGFMALLTIFWSIPVSFVGVLTNIDYLTEKVPFLSFLNNIPSAVLGVITGLLPSILLALLMILVPIICRALAKQAGAVTLPEVEMKTQEWYFGFQLIQVFLVTTFSSGASAVVAQIIQSPTLAPALLAKNLPKASNFYISYFILYGLVSSCKSLFNLMELLTFNAVGKFRDKTPREMFYRYTKLKGLHWGKEYPKWTNLAVIAIVYSCIAPLILGFATIGLGFIYLAFRYRSFFTVTTKYDTHGQAYGRALQQLTTGVYIAELCLIGLFAINIGTSATSSGPMTLMFLFLVVTILYHITVRRIFHSLTIHLPESLYCEEDELEAQEQVETGIGNNNAQIRTQGVSTAQSSKEMKQQQQTVQKKGTMLSRFMNPRKYASYSQIRLLMRSTDHNAPIRHPEETVRDAYFNPSIRSETPTLWIPKDQLGISTMECSDIGEVLSISDERAWIDEKGRIEWDRENLQSVPIWKEDYTLLI